MFSAAFISAILGFYGLGNAVPHDLLLAQKAARRRASKDETLYQTEIRKRERTPQVLREAGR